MDVQRRPCIEKRGIRDQLVIATVLRMIYIQHVSKQFFFFCAQYTTNPNEVPPKHRKYVILETTSSRCISDRSEPEETQDVVHRYLVSPL